MHFLRSWNKTVNWKDVFHAVYGDNCAFFHLCDSKWTAACQEIIINELCHSRLEQLDYPQLSAHISALRPVSKYRDSQEMKSVELWLSSAHIY